MITRDLYSLRHPSAPIAVNYSTRARCEEWRDRDPMRRPAETYVIAPVPHCACCGAAFPNERNSLTTWSNGETRCDRHHDRNPCAIEGCRRTRAVTLDAQGWPYMARDHWLCGEHWRRFVPPRSRRRRAYHAYFRRAKRIGWRPELNARFWRFWVALVRQAQRKAVGGTIDEAEINRLFGWDAVGGTA